jgi:acyl carrier protein
VAAKLSDLGWDSLCSLEFMAACDSELGIELDTAALANARSVGDLHSLAILALG